MQTFILTNFFWLHDWCVCVRRAACGVCARVSSHFIVAIQAAALICATPNASIIFTNIVLYRNLKLPEWDSVHYSGRLADYATSGVCVCVDEGKVALLFAKLITLHRTE